MSLIKRNKFMILFFLSIVPTMITATIYVKYEIMIINYYILLALYPVTIFLSLFAYAEKMYNFKNPGGIV